MIRKTTVLTTALFVWVTAAGQGSIDRVLREVEANNRGLDARSWLTEAEVLAEKVGNSLPDPEVGYEQTWGNPSSLGKQGEITAIQAFDFPTAYAARNRLAKLRGKQYAGEYDLYRQQVLLEAHDLCVEIISLRRRRELLGMRSGFAEEIAMASGKMLAAGQVDVLHASEARVQFLASNNEIGLLDVEIADALGRLRILNGGMEIDFPDREFPAVAGLMPYEQIAGIYLESDPALLRAVAERDAVSQEVRASRSASLPRLALGYKHEYGGGERFNGVIVGVSVPMFGNRHNVRRAQARERYAMVQAEEARITTEQYLATLYAKAAILEESIRGYEEITADTETYLSNLSKALESGRISITDYFTQYDGIMAFEEALIELVGQYHLVRGRIYSVML